MRRIVQSSIISGALLAAACNESPTVVECENPLQIAAPARMPLLEALGDTLRLTVIPNPCLLGNSPILEWATSNDAVAGVVDGLVTARAEGEAIIAVAGGGQFDSLTVNVDFPDTLEMIILAPATVRQGDVIQLEAGMFRSDGVVDTLRAGIVWSTLDNAVTIDNDGLVTAYGAGNSARIIARSGAFTDTLTLPVVPRALTGSFSIVGRGPVTSRYTSDLWVFDDVAYTGTWSCRSAKGVQPGCGDRLYAWDIRDPANPVLTDSVVVVAVVVDDLMISADGSFAALTHEGSVDKQNGITLMDTSDPFHPRVITRYTRGLENGVHTLWIERIDARDYVFAVEDPGTTAFGMHILDVTDRANPVEVSHFYSGTSLVHDIYVRDGLAFVSHWDAGLIILDVGNGIKGGSPANPVEVSRIATLDGETHNAWYWPEAGYVFVGEEDFKAPGRMHVVDVHDLTKPVKVAEFFVDGDTPHNFWMDESAGILYAAWYSRGLRAIDVTGTLRGALHLQGREYAVAMPFATSGLTVSIQAACHPEAGLPGSNTGCVDPVMMWGPQLHRGLVYATDMINGLWVLRLNR